MDNTQCKYLSNVNRIQMNCSPEMLADSVELTPVSVRIECFTLIEWSVETSYPIGKLVDDKRTTA